MARPLRIEFPGAVYHVTSRGNARGMIYDEDNDRECFFEILANVVQKYRWICHAYCLMGNHYHLLIETPEANLSRGMRQLNWIYTQSYNRFHKRSGHLFQGRFKAILVEKESYLLELCRYIVLNPVAAGIVDVPESWRWSSFRSMVGLSPTPDLLTTEWVLAQFGKGVVNGRRRYADFVCTGMGASSPWSDLRGGILLGQEEFVEKLQQQLSQRAEESEVPRRERLVHRPSLKRLLLARAGKDERCQAAHLAHVNWGYTLKEIGEFWGLHYATVSKMVKRAAE